MPLKPVSDPTVLQQLNGSPAPDYDYEGARAAGAGQAANGHWPDTYKLPNHITFSTDSKYSKPGQEGGTWSEVGGKWHYKPSDFVLTQHSPEELKDYFSRNEPDSVLDLPASSARKPVSDPAILQQLEAPTAAPQPDLLDRTIALASANHPLLTSLGEMGAHAATAGVAGPVAGLLGIGGSVLPGPAGQGARFVEGVQSGLTYDPRSPSGQLLAKVGSFLPGLIAKGGDVTGQAVSDVTGSPALGAATNTAVQMAPALLLRGRAGKVAENVDRGTPAPARAARPAAASEKAPAAAERPAGLARVSGTTKEIVGPPTPAEARYRQLQSLPVPVPATRGQITRDPVQLRNEGNVSATETGKPIRDIYLAQNEAILNNLEVLKGRVANKTKPAETPEQVGLSVQDQALRAKLELSKKQVKDAYAKAEAAGELQGKVSPARIIKTIRGTPDTTHFGWVESWLSKAKVIEKTDAGTVTRKLTLKELEDLRQAAVARAMDGGTEGFYAGKVIRAIDETTEGAGGKLYKEARAKRRAQATEFEETGAVARLVENKSRTDRATAVEDTWRKTVLGGSIEDLRNVKRSLLTGGDAKTRTAGRRAWRDLKAETIEHIRREATKGVATNERGQPNVTPAAMKRAIDSIGADKLNEVFGPGTAVQLQRIMDATRTVKTAPPAGHAGSSTMGNVLAYLERGLGKIPVVGSTASGAVSVGIKLHQMGANRRIVREAQRMPSNALADIPQPKKVNALLEH